MRTLKISKNSLCNALFTKYTMKFQKIYTHTKTESNGQFSFPEQNSFGSKAKFKFGSWVAKKF